LTGGLRRAAAAAPFAVLAGCLTFGAEPGPPKGTYRERLHGFARLLAMEDRRAYDPLLAGRTASSPDAWLRAKTALAVGRLRDPDAGALLPPLLIDAEPSVRRAAAFAAGVSGDTRLVPLLAKTLSDPDAGMAASAAEALGKLGGRDATDALIAALAQRERAASTRGAAALALFRNPEGRTVAALSAVVGKEPLPPELRQAVVYALARKPLPEAAPALRAVLRTRREGDQAAPSDELAWAARGLGLLEDEESAPDLVGLAASDDKSVFVQALVALHSLSEKTALYRNEDLARRAREAAVAHANDAFPGVAVAALRLLGALPDAPESRAVLEENLRRKGWRGQTALVSLTRLDAARAPEEAAVRIDRELVGGTLEQRLGAAEALGYLSGQEHESEKRDKEGISLKDPLATTLLADRAARVRAAALSSLLRKSSSSGASRWFLVGLIDRDPAVREVALQEAAPLLASGSDDLRRAWDAAFRHAFDPVEPDFAVGALDAAAARGESGRILVAAHANDRDDVTREKARRLLAEKYGAPPRSFVPVPVKTRLSRDDYDRLARSANESLFSATVETVRGSARIDLDAEEAPATLENFRALAAKRFFDGLVIHRVVPDFVVQTGDPRGDGSGGPGYAIRDEVNALRYARGAVGMALSGRDTGGSQWFVTLAPQIHLDGSYTVFGRVAAGMETFDRIEQDDRLVSVRVTESARPTRPPGAAP
jgi:cyclophilin family peptidyl-prolyl cis-trans isomerase/HEAT repeat protein